MTPLQRAPADGSRIRRSRLVIAAAVVAAAVVAAAVAWTLTRPSNQFTAPVESEAGPPAADSTRWTSIAWQAADPAVVPDPLVPRSVKGIAADGTTIAVWGSTVGVGHTGATDEVAVSRDGRSWDHSRIDAGLGSDEEVDISAVSVSERGVIVMGRTCCAEQQTAVWHSATGVGWARLPVRGALEDPSAGIFDVASGPHGYVAAGTLGGHAEPRVWTSRDGSEWRDTVGFDLPDESFISDVAATPDGFVAVGGAPAVDGRSIGLVLTSADGVRWARAGEGSAALSAPGNTVLFRAVPYGGGLLIVGNHSPPPRAECGADPTCGVVDPPEYWLSADGVTFEMLESDLELALTDYQSVVAGGPGLVAFASELPGPPAPGQDAIWTSSDGRSWEAVETVEPLPDRLQVQAIAVLGRRLVAIGPNLGVRGGLAAEVWIGEVR
jgi:hypothetical protein